MVDAVPQRGVPASSVHTGGRSVEIEGSVGNDGSDDNSDESIGRPVAVGEGGLVVVVVGDAPAPVTPMPTAPNESEAPNNETAMKR
jgi:hypothetical protein